MSTSYTAFHENAALVPYHRAVADEGLVEVNLLFIDQLAESSDLSNLLNNHSFVLSISIDSHTFNDKKKITKSGQFSQLAQAPTHCTITYQQSHNLCIPDETNLESRCRR
jgi:hypothetical protein